MGRADPRAGGPELQPVRRPGHPRPAPGNHRTHPGPVLGVTEAAGGGIVKALLSAGYVDNRAAAGSGNRRELHLTSAGEEKAEQCGRLLGSSLDDNARTIGLDPQALAQTIRDLHDEVRTVRNP